MEVVTKYMNIAVLVGRAFAVLGVIASLAENQLTVAAAGGITVRFAVAVIKNHLICA